MQRAPWEDEGPVAWCAVLHQGLAVPSCFGFCAQSHSLSTTCSDMTVHYHDLLKLGFSAKAGSCSARWDRTAASTGLMAPQSLRVPMGRPCPHLQKQQDWCPPAPWRWEGPWWGPSFCTTAALLCRSFTGTVRRMRWPHCQNCTYREWLPAVAVKHTVKTSLFPLPQEGHQQAVVVLLLGC